MQKTTLTSSPLKGKQLIDEDEAATWIKKLDLAFLREAISPVVAFKNADTDNSGIITTMELEKAIKRLLPEESFSVIELRKIQQAFDINRDQRID